MPRDGGPNRTRIIDAAERLVIDNGFAATSVDQVLREAGTSKGAFFHHFDSKLALARALTERYVAADIAQLRAGLDATARVTDPGERVLAFVRFYEDRADEIMSAQSSCLYVAVLTEQELVGNGTAEVITTAIETWRAEIAALLTAAGLDDTEALADHVFVTFEGAFLLCRSTGDPTHMRTQLGTLRRLLAGLLASSGAPPAELSEDGRRRPRAPRPGP